MGINGVKRTSSTYSFGISSSSKGTGGNFSESFQQQLGSESREQYRERINTLFDELNAQASHILEKIDVLQFERYRESIRQLMNEVVRHAYAFQSERVLDSFGYPKVYATIQVIDQKLDELASKILEQNAEKLSFIGRVDEIRGLMMDLLL